MVHWISQTKTTRSIHKHPLIRTQSASHKLYRHWKLYIQARRTHSSFEAKHLYTKPNWLSLLTSIDHASSFFRNLTKYKIYTYTQRSSFQLQFFNKVKGTSLLQPLPITPHRSCLTWPYNHKTKSLTLFINRRLISTRPALRNFSKPRIYTHNIPATFTTLHKASNYLSITRLA